MDTKRYERAIALMDYMGFDENEKELACSNEDYLEKIVEDPDTYNKNFFTQLYDMLHGW